ncbi:MAG: glycosyltransferase family 2 protein [bacterium]
MKRKDITPPVTLIISAYNEEKIIASKIENALSLDYPKERFEIIVVSDCSTDKTDEIVRKYLSLDVKLLRQNERYGKTEGINKAVHNASGDIIIFSDANAIYEKNAIRELVRNFNDQTIGCVTGEARYIERWKTSSERSESLYWKYEIFLKTLESDIGSMVGGDGAIYAIRKELFEELQPSDINDFVNPLQIIVKGFRGVYEPEAVCYEETADSLLKEFKRKRRIINRSWNGLFRVKEVLNPLKVGFFAIEIISHKLLRWLIPFFLLSLFFANLGLVGPRHAILYTVSLLLQCAFYLLSYLGYLRKDQTSFIFYMPYYFCLVNTASMIGIIQYFMGSVITVWSPERGNVPSKGLSFRRSSMKSFKVLLSVLSILLIVWLLNWSQLFPSLLLVLFWLSLSLICYTYFFYPLVLTIVTAFNKKCVEKADILPQVSLLIPAYNEETEIEQKLQNSLFLNYPADKLRIVVASDGSRDGTNEIVTRYLNKGIELYPYQQRRGKISAINDTMKMIDSDIVVFSDANAIYHPDAITKLVRNFNDPTVGAVSGDAQFVNDKTSIRQAVKLYYKYERFLQKKETELNSLVGADGAIFAIRRQLFEPVPSDIILDDFVIPMRIAKKGLRVVYEEDAKAFEAAPSGLREEFNRKIRLIAGAVQAFKLKLGRPGFREVPLSFSYISHKVIRWLVPVLGIVLYFSNLFLIESLLYSTLFFAQTVILVLALVGSRYSSTVFAVPFYLVFNNLAMLIGLWKGVFDKQSVKWTRFERQGLPVVEHQPEMLEEFRS